jgi:hypothetical protein
MRTEEQAYSLINEWHSVSIGKPIERKDIFFQFMAGWVSMNALYNWYGKAASLSGDKKKLTRFADANDKAKKLHKSLLHSNAEYKNAVDVLSKKGILDVANGNRVFIADEEDFEQVMLCVYQVRNNLFHGDKLMGNERDEEVVTASYQIISNFLREYLVEAKSDLFGIDSATSH